MNFIISKYLDPRKYYRYIQRNIEKSRKISYSQCGEDIIIANIFHDLKKDHIFYMDIGAHHPIRINNTYYFYRRGNHGILVEANPIMVKKLTKVRPKDIVIHTGISNKKGTATYYTLEPDTLSTFSKEEVEYQEKEFGRKALKIQEMEMNTVSDILKNAGIPKSPDLISLDIEGLNLSVLQSIDWNLLSPTVLCVETISYSEKRLGKKDVAVIEFLKKKGYLVYADTYINTIFVKESVWKKYA